MRHSISSWWRLSSGIIASSATTRSADRSGKTDGSPHRYWQQSFPPTAPLHWPLWLLRTHTGGLFAYPVGGPAPGSAAWSPRARRRLAPVVARPEPLLLLCVLPFALTLFAACLGKYPYGGSAHRGEHLAPPACLLIAAGAAALLGHLRGTAPAGPAWSAWCSPASVSAASCAHFRKPYKTDYDRFARRPGA